VTNKYKITKKTTMEFSNETTIHFMHLVGQASGSHLLASAGHLEWSCDKNFFDSVAVGDVITLTTTYEKDIA
jgi:hypothetical protein